MSTVHRWFRCDASAVFEVLADGWLYPTWVVGAARMRDVDRAWPQPGARLRHSVGTWPLLLDDTTSSVEWQPPRRMVMRARGWPIGEARVEIDVAPRDGGCVVRMREYAERGPARLVPGLLADLVLGPRNRETLRRLASLAEGRASESHEAGTVGSDAAATLAADPLPGQAGVDSV